MATNWPLLADSIMAPQTWTTRTPSSRMTMSVSPPRTASRKFSCSPRSGSGLAVASLTTSPSLTPRNCAMSSRVVVIADDQEAADWLMALTPGGVDQDLLRLGHRHLQSPMTPFDADGPRVFCGQVS